MTANALTFRSSGFILNGLWLICCTVYLYLNYHNSPAWFDTQWLLCSCLATILDWSPYPVPPSRLCSLPNTHPKSVDALAKHLQLPHATAVLFRGAACHRTGF